MFIINININVTKSSSSCSGDGQMKKKREVGSLEALKKTQFLFSMCLTYRKLKNQSIPLSTPYAT